MQKRKNFQVTKLGLALATAFAAQSGMQVAYAGAGWGDNTDFAGQAIKVPTFYANSPSGMRADQRPGAAVGAVVNTGTALRKFVDTLPGLSPAGANNLGQYLPLAVADTAAYPGSDYYEIAVVEYTEKMHSDLPKGTTLRGYVQIETAANAAVSKHIKLTYPGGAPILDQAGNQVYAVDNPHYLGPVVLAVKGTATRFKFTNYLPTGTVTKDGAGKVVSRQGDLFLPVDTTLLGANVGPSGNAYTQNRAEVHLHGGDTPWISDGTPHQWITPVGQEAPNAAGVTPADKMLRGVSTRNVPDMPDPGEGSVTYYFPNNQSGRLMFYHDHSSGLTRVNVYAGEAAGYVLLDKVEIDLMKAGVIPGMKADGTLDGSMIPLVIQDKTFVPQDIDQQDGRWDTKAWGEYGDLWFPHVYETNQDPNSFDGTNPVGRWDYGPWFWPVFPAPLAMPTGAYGDASTTPEAFMDTPVVNGTAYPVLNVDPKAYRFRVLNAGNDRFLNLGLYVADASKLSSDGRANTEIKMVPSSPAASNLAACAVDAAGVETNPRPGAACWPSYWPTDNRPEGAPDPAGVGPDIVVIGNEGGFIPNPHVIPSSPIVYELNRRSITVLNVLTSGLYLGNAERADVVVDFSAYAGKTLILYNDAPAPVPAFDPRIDYFTDNGDQTTAGGAESTKAGFGPNTRTVMQIRVSNAAPAAPYNLAKLQTELPKAYGLGADKPIIGQSAYNAAFGTAFQDTYAKIRTGSGQQPEFIWTAHAAGQTITKFKVTDGGLGYLVAPTVVISHGGLAAPRDDLATATLEFDAAGKPTGRIKEVTLTAAGAAQLFDAAPVVTFTAHASGGIGATASVYTNLTQTKTVQNKAIQELFDPNYGRMNATLGVELPFSTALTQTTVPLGYVDPATEILQSAEYQVDATGKAILGPGDLPTELNPDGKTQIWKITHNGVDTHPVHFHLMNVQLVNRIGWDGTIKPPSPSELGWKETIKMNPLEDIVVAISPKTPLVPFGVPLSTRFRDPAQAPNGIDGFTQIDFKQYLADGSLNPSFGLTVPAGTVKNTKEDYEWEYVWHCHILGHEENDFMRPVVYKFGGIKPDAATGVAVTNEGIVTWVDDTPVADARTIYSKKNEIGFRLERAPGDVPVDGVAPVLPAAPVWAPVGTTLSNATTFTDPYITDPAKALEVSGKVFWYRVVAFNDQGESASVPASLKVAAGAGPTAPTALVATVVSSSVVNLVWADNSDNESGFKITRCVWDAAAAAGAGACVGAPTSVATVAANVKAFSDTTASAETSYQYQVVAVNAAGPSTEALSNIVKTLPAPAIAPSKLAAVWGAATDTSVVLTWQDNSNNESGFLVQRSADGGVSWTDVCVAVCTPVAQTAGGNINTSVTAGILTLTDTGLTQNTLYIYRVAAVTAVGAAQSTPVSITTDYAAAPAVGAVTPTSDWNKVSLSWAIAAPSTSFEIVRTGGAGPAVTTVVAGNAVGAVGPNVWLDNAVVQNTAYTYTVKAINGPKIGGTVGTANTTTLYAPAPAMGFLTGTVGDVAGAPVINLNWTGLTPVTFATGVRIVRCQQTAANFNCTLPTSVFSEVFRKDVVGAAGADTLPKNWTDTAVLPSTGYTYKAYFVNGTVPAGAENAGTAALSNVDVPQAFDVLAPTTFTATFNLSRARVDLAWVDGSGGLTAGGAPTVNETAFVIERSIDGVNFSQIGTAASSTSAGSAKTFSDTAVAPGIVYTYRVKAVSVIGGSTTSSGYAPAVGVDLRIGAPSALGAVVSATQVALTWTDNAMYQDAIGFAVLRSADGGTTWTQIGTASSQTGTGGTRSYNDNALNLVPSASYQYAVQALWTFNGVLYKSDMSTSTSAVTPPLLAPTTMTTSINFAGNLLVVFRDNALNETGFEVERSENGGAFVQVATPLKSAQGTTSTQSLYDPTVATVGSTYVYRARAVYVAGATTVTSDWLVSSPIFYGAPDAPATVTATPQRGQFNRVDWTVTAGPGDTAGGFSVWGRRQAANGTWPAFTALRTVNGGASRTWNHNGLTVGQVWEYEVRANSAAAALGSSGFTVSATPVTVLP